jgi:hypothetical protein
MDDYVNRQRQGYDADAVLDSAANLTTTSTGSALDIGENVELDVVARVGGAIGGTSPTADVVIQCASDAAFTTPVVIATFSQIDDSVTPLVARQMCRTSERYVRAVTTVGGTSPDFADFEVYIAS